MQRALDVLVYAPAGFVIQATEDFPAMAAKGRDRLEVHVENARIVGMFVVNKTRSDLERRVERTQHLSGRTQSAPAGDHASPEPGPSADEEATARPPGEPARSPYPAGATPPSTPHLRSLPSDRAGTAAADAAIEGYDTLSASQVVRRLDGLGADELHAVYRHEAATRGRRTILHRAQQLLGTAEPPSPGTGSDRA
jgi:hypothetical protein